MKTGFFSIAALAFLQLASTQPHRKSSDRIGSETATDPNKGPQHQHLKRQGQPDVVTDVDYTTIDAEDVIVYVDTNGSPVSTTTIHRGQAAPTTPPTDPSPQPPASTTNPPATYQPPNLPASQASRPPIPIHSSPPAASPPSPSTGGATSSGPGFSHGLSYSPYNADNSCKSTSAVAKDFSEISDYSVIRLYGTDCNQVANVLAATQGSNVQLFLGIFDLSQVQNECQTIASAVKGDWSRINTVSVGNELVNQGTAPGAITGAIGQARSALKAAGYNGPVVTVDTMMAMANHPEICKASDYCAINCHAFFDGKTPAEKSGEFVKGWVDKIGQATGKTVVVTETGWPTQGNTNGVAVPSKPNQDAALQSIRDSLPQNVIFYSAYNDLWKKNSAATFDAEQFWGILGNAPS